MQYNIVPLTVENITRLDSQPFQKMDHEYVKSLDLKSMIDSISGSCLERDGKIIGCSGMLKLWSGRWQGWALYGERLNFKDFVHIRTATKEFLDSSMARTDVSRIEITVVLDFVNGHHFAKSLGFIPEGIMRCYDMIGRDHVLYARVKNGT